MIAIMLLNIFPLKNNVYALENDEKLTDSQIKDEIERIYNVRSACLVSGDCTPLKELFDTSRKYGKWALEHEVRRVKYLSNWTNERDITFTNIQSFVRIKKVYPQGKIIKAALEESYKFDYTYCDDEKNAINSFGVGIRHTTSLIKKDDKWLIYNDWYTDCFEDAMQAYDGEIPNNPEVSLQKVNKGNLFSEASLNFKPFYNRENAVAYADKYCGAAWGSGNNYKYNKKYNDYNGIGGDCTNFASQVLGDKEGGGMSLTGAWVPHSNAWANADGLKNYLVSSGRGSIIKIGTFKELTEASSSLPGGAVSKLKLGDLIAYEKGKGNIDHFAVITGFDSKGYPLVNSHTTDRYHVPWDLGWGDKKIRFFLIHING
ncbi:amidase domain-containing protein [Clostridium rhizosphaerae]